MNHETDVLEYISNQMHQISDYMAKKYPERRWMYEPQRLYWKRIYQAKEEGRPVIWHNLGVTPEPFNAMGAATICMEGMATTLAALRMGVGKYIDTAHKVQ